MSRRRRALQLAIAGPACALLLGACGDPGAATNLPVEQDVSLCGFRSLIDGMQEPAPHDGAAVILWASALQSYADHLRVDRIPSKTKVSAAVAGDVQVIRSDARGYATAVRSAAGSAPRLDAAFASLASTAFTKAVADVYEWDVANCQGNG